MHVLKKMYANCAFLRRFSVVPKMRIFLFLALFSAPAFAIFPAIIPGVQALLVWGGATEALAFAADVSLALHLGALVSFLSTSSNSTLEIGPHAATDNPSTPAPPSTYWHITQLPLALDNADFYTGLDQFITTYSCHYNLAGVNYSFTAHDMLGYAPGASTQYMNMDGKTIICSGASPTQYITGYLRSAAEGSDSRCSMRRNGNNGWATDDPDCATHTGAMTVYLDSPSSDFKLPPAGGSVPSDAPVVATMSADGTVSIVEHYALPDGQTKNISTSLSAPDPSDGSVSVVGQSINTSVGVGSSEIILPPVDNSGVESRLDAIKQAEDADRQSADDANAAYSPDSSANPKIGDFLFPSQGDFSASPPSLDLPSSDGSCKTLPVSFGIFNFVLDPCPVVSAVMPLVDWLIIVLSIITGVFILVSPTRT